MPVVIVRIVIGAAIAVVGAAVGWSARGRKENKRHARTQEIVKKMDERVRKLEKEKGRNHG
jgi:hypothetical protein